MQQQPNPSEPNTRIVTALLGTVVFGLIAVSYPMLIPALTVACAAFMALAIILKL
ncbi:hypothetical protein ACFYXW_12455 [Streptomyces sp. NPDC001981]|uniref:hypothetical protein n=1 Tax=Streptomyces sp. NPDC001981 TaxID=3364628 RepID=UPI0036B9F183